MVSQPVQTNPTKGSETDPWDEMDPYSKAIARLAGPAIARAVAWLSIIFWAIIFLAITMLLYFLGTGWLIPAIVSCVILGILIYLVSSADWEVEGERSISRERPSGKS